MGSATDRQAHCQAALNQARTSQIPSCQFAVPAMSHTPAASPQPPVPSMEGPSSTHPPTSTCAVLQCPAGRWVCCSTGGQAQQPQPTPAGALQAGGAGGWWANRSNNINSCRAIALFLAGRACRNDRCWHGGKSNTASNQRRHCQPANTASFSENSVCLVLHAPRALSCSPATSVPAKRSSPGSVSTL